MMMVACNAESNLRKGDQFMSRGEYYDAAAEYKIAYARTSTRDRSRRGERALKMAECYRRINYTSKAIGAYQNGIRYLMKGHQDRKKVNPDEVSEEEDSILAVTLADATLKLARLQHKSGDYKNALISYQTFRQMIGTAPQDPEYSEQWSMFNVRRRTHPRHPRHERHRRLPHGPAVETEAHASHHR